MDQTLNIDTPDGPMQAYVALPNNAGRRPALLVLQEAFGVNHHIKNICQRLAARGYVALAPELFHRTGTGVELGYTDLSLVMPHFSRLTNASLSTDISASLAALRAHERVDPARTGVIGFCVGGFATFLAAQQTDASAFVAFYGGGIVHARPGLGLEPLLASADRIRKPILLIFGEEDKGIPMADVEAIGRRLTELGAPHQIVTYPEAGHGFACDERASFHPASSEKAWQTTFDWLTRNL